MSLTTIRHLVKAEIKQYKWTILLLTALLIGLVLLSISATYSFTSEQLLDDTPIFVTTIFLLNVVIILVRPKTFRSQNISYNFRACEHLLHLQQLPLKKSTIIFYRMITNYVILIPSLLLYSITIYIVIQPLQELLPFGNFLVFIILLLAVSIIMLDVQVIVDFGTNILFSYIYLIFIFLPVTITIIAL